MPRTFCNIIVWLVMCRRCGDGFQSTALSSAIAMVEVVREKAAK